MRHRSLVVVVSIGLLASPAQADEPAKPKFVPMVEKPSYQRTRCTPSCAARDIGGPAASKLVVAVRRVPSSATIRPTEPRLVLQRDQDDDVRTQDAKFNDGEVPAIEVDAVDELPAGSYNGSVVADVPGGEPLAVPVALDVRDGPEGALALLILSVAAGALLGLLLEQRPKAKFKKSADALRTRIAALPSEEREILLPLWTAVWDGRGDKPAPAKLAALEKGADALVRCRDAQDEALRSPQAGALRGWTQRIGVAVHDVIQAVRSFAESYDDKLAVVAGTSDDFKTAAKAEAKLSDLAARASAGETQPAQYLRFTTAVAETRAALAGVPAQPSQPAPDLVPLLTAVDAAFTALEAAHGSPLDAPPETGDATAAGLGGLERRALSLLGWPVQTAATAQGEADSARAFDVGAWIGTTLAPLAAAAVAVVLLAVGFKVTYLDNTTFGAKLTDWLALVFWGLAAWGARRTLTGLGQAPEPVK